MRMMGKVRPWLRCAFGKAFLYHHRVLKLGILTSNSRVKQDNHDITSQTCPWAVAKLRLEPRSELFLSTTGSCCITMVRRSPAQTSLTSVTSTKPFHLSEYLCKIKTLCIQILSLNTWKISKNSVISNGKNLSWFVDYKQTFHSKQYMNLLMNSNNGSKYYIITICFTLHLYHVA